MDTLLQDLRYASRRLINSAGVTLIAVATLALGIGATTAIFSVVQGVLLRSLPYQDPERVAVIGHLHAERGVVFNQFSPQDFDDLRAANSGFERVSSYAFVPGLTEENLSGAGDPVRIETAYVSTDFFEILGLPAMMGRGFQPEENIPGRDRVVVLSDRLWRQRFSADQSIVGRSILLDRAPYVVVGVMPRRFQFPARDVDAWMPLSLQGEDATPHQRGIRWLTAVGRLAPGVTMAEAQARTSAVIGGLERQYPESNKGFRAAVLQPLPEALLGSVRPVLLILLGAVGLVLLIACANVANLLLAQGTGRWREIAVRAALGARRGRIVRQLLSESILLSLLGGVAGVAIAIWGVDLLVKASAGRIPRPDEIGINPPVLIFALTISLATGIVFGILPAWRSSRIDLRDSLAEGGRTGSGGARGQRARNSLVVAETALAVVLLTGASLMLRSFWRLTHVDVGVESERVLTFAFSLSNNQFPTIESELAYKDEIFRRIAAVPGVLAVGGSKTLLLRGGGEPYNFVIKDTRGEIPVNTGSGAYIITPGYFKALGIPLVSGRDFTANEPGPTLIINQASARAYWPGQDPVGQRVKLGRFDFTIIGVVGDVRNDGLTADARTALYVHTARFPRGTTNVYIRTNGNPVIVMRAVRDAVREAAPDQPIAGLQPLLGSIAETVAQPRFFTLLLGLFGGLALALACLGTYGVVSYTVGLRSHELGIRTALGASARDLVGMVVRQAMTLSVSGVLLGLLGALALTRLLSGLLYDVSPRDPLMFGAGAAFLVLSAFVASYLPARRAARVDPVRSLKSE